MSVSKPKVGSPKLGMLSTYEPKSKPNLPSFLADLYKEIKSTWSSNLVAISTPGDGMCFWHSLLNSSSRNYQENPGFEYRETMCKKLSRDIGLSLKKEIIPEVTYWEASDLPFLYSLQIENPELIEGKEGIHNVDPDELIEYFTKDGNWISVELFSLISLLLHIDIYAFTADKNDITLTYTTAYLDSNKQSVLLLGNGVHFESLGYKTKKGIQTVFSPEDDFIQKVNEIWPLEERNLEARIQNIEITKKIKKLPKDNLFYLMLKKHNRL